MTEHTDIDQPLDANDMLDDAQASTEDATVRGGMKHVSDAAGKTAMAAVLAGSIAAGANAVTPDQIHLPDPVPIVQMVDTPSADLPDNPADDQDKQKSSAWKKALKFLLVALATMLLLASIALGAMQGCTSCAGSLAAPVLNSSSEQATSQTS